MNILHQSLIPQSQFSHMLNGWVGVNDVYRVTGSSYPLGAVSFYLHIPRTQPRTWCTPHSGSPYVCANASASSPTSAVALTHQELNSVACLRLLEFWAKPWTGKDVYDADRLRKIFLQRRSSLGPADCVGCSGESIPLHLGSAFHGGWEDGDG